MSGYLDRIGAGKVLVDREPFFFDWTPDKLVGRDEELTELASLFTHIENQILVVEQLLRVLLVQERLY